MWLMINIMKSVTVFNNGIFSQRIFCSCALIMPVVINAALVACGVIIVIHLTVNDVLQLSLLLLLF